MPTNPSEPSTTTTKIACCNVTLEQAHELFREGVKSKQENGDKTYSYLDELLRVMAFMEYHNRSFTLDEVVMNSKSLDIPAETIKALFGKYVECLESLHKLTRIQGSYDADTFSWN